MLHIPMKLTVTEVAAGSTFSAMVTESPDLYLTGASMVSTYKIFR